MKCSQKESGPYWSTLTADKKKPHFLKVDFNKWVDETSDNEETFKPIDFNDCLQQNGGANPVFYDSDEEEEDEKESKEDELKKDEPEEPNKEQEEIKNEETLKSN